MRRRIEPSDWDDWYGDYLFEQCFGRMGLEVLTLYAFSTENWKRPKSEVKTLMTLLRRYLKQERQTLIGENYG